MRSPQLSVVVALALLLVGGCGDGQAVLEPGAPQAAPAGSSPTARPLAGPPIAAAGSFDAEVDLETLTFRSQGNHCLLEVEGRLIFSGTLVGEAPGRTTARVFATCEEALSNPLGTFPDVFRSELEFTGTVNGVPVQASMVYQGRAEVGGQIDARIHLSGGLRGVLHADAQLAVGGTYTGQVIVR